SAPSAARARSDSRPRRARSARVPIDAARHGRRDRTGIGLPVLGTGRVRTAWVSGDALRGTSLRRRSDQLVDSESRVRRGDAAIVRVRDREKPWRRGVHLPARLGARTGRRVRAMVEAVMFWNEPNNKSHWNFEIDEGWCTFAAMVRAAAGAVAA